MKKILQVFKKLFSRDHKTSGRTYVCDPQKNKECSKDACWDIYHGPCKCTLKKKYAKLDFNGKPIIATDDDKCNLEWMEEQAALYRQLTDRIET